MLPEEVGEGHRSEQDELDPEGEIAYLDTSAFLKLVVEEAESAALERRLRQVSITASAAVLHIEAIRSARLYGQDAEERARQHLVNVNLIEMDGELLEEAATLPVQAKSLDALHLAAAAALVPQLGVLLTYDQQMIKAAQNLGLPVESPL